MASEPIVNRLFREGVRRGLGGSQTWMTVAVAAGTVRVLRRMTNPPPQVVWRQAMRSGDRFEVNVLEPPPTRRQRRKARARAQKATRKRR
ncbi:MAG TPA: hypothetical protein VGI86_18120 [Acidimicrobiia bacterium]